MKSVLQSFLETPKNVWTQSFLKIITSCEDESPHELNSFFNMLFTSSRIQRKTLRVILEIHQFLNAHLDSPHTKKSRYYLSAALWLFSEENSALTQAERDSLLAKYLTRMNSTSAFDPDSMLDRYAEEIFLLMDDLCRTRTRKRKRQSD